MIAYRETWDALSAFIQTNDIGLVVMGVAQVAKTVKEISKPGKKQKRVTGKKDYLDEQTHEEDQILVLKRRRESHKQEEAFR